MGRWAGRSGWRLPTPKGQTVGSFRKGHAMLPKAISEKCRSSAIVFKRRLRYRSLQVPRHLFLYVYNAPKRFRVPSLESAVLSLLRLAVFVESAEVNFFSEYGEGSRYKFENVKGHAPEEFAARNDLVQTLHRIQALPDGAAAAPKPSGGG
ncbi:hypothetical protein Tco_0681016 [Tanacetum coccineum]|uniref:Uncharacterized protein n=1 Tax=Tanacetum coccineum TaxID=301880 RepID=A0ABQ4XM72_9ASTR